MQLVYPMHLFSPGFIFQDQSIKVYSFDCGLIGKIVSTQNISAPLRNLDPKKKQQCCTVFINSQGNSKGIYSRVMLSGILVICPI